MAIGVAFALVGGSLIASFYFISSGMPSAASSTPVQLSVPSGQTWDDPLSGLSSGSGTIGLSWTSSGFANVTLSKAVTCPGGSGLCPSDPPLAAWSSAARGAWSQGGSFSTTYVLTVTNAQNRALNFSATFDESRMTSGFGLPTTTWVLLTIGSILLLGTGAVGVFLGLFLPGGIYARRNGPEEYWDEDGDELTGPDDHGGPGGGPDLGP